MHAVSSSTREQCGVVMASTSPHTDSVRVRKQLDDQILSESHMSFSSAAMVQLTRPRFPVIEYKLVMMDPLVQFYHQIWCKRLHH